MYSCSGANGSGPCASGCVSSSSDRCSTRTPAGNAVSNAPRICAATSGENASARNENFANSTSRRRSTASPSSLPRSPSACASGTASGAGARKTWWEPAANSARKRSPSDPAASATSLPKTPPACSPRPARNPATKARRVRSVPSTTSSCHSAMIDLSREEYQRRQRKHGNQDRQRVAQDVPEERRHRHSRLLRDRLHHEVGRISDVRIRPHEDRPGRDRLQKGVVLGDEAMDRLALRHAWIQPAERGRQEGEVGGRVVEERGQDSARPEEMRRLAHGANDERECALLAHAQHGEHGNDGREDAREQDRYLLDRLPGELVLLANAPRRRPPGGRQHEEEDRVAHQVLHLLRDAEDRDLTEVHGPGEDDGGQHAAEEEDVVPALHPDRLAGPGRPCAQERVLAAPPVEIEEQVRAEDRARGEQHLLPDREGPEERHAVEEAQEERRVA